MTTRFLSFCGRLFLGLVVVGGVLVLVVGPKDTASLYGTGATVGGVSTGITAGSLGSYFGSIDDGFSLVDKDKAADVKGWGDIVEDEKKEAAKS